MSTTAIQGGTVCSGAYVIFSDNAHTHIHTTHTFYYGWEYIVTLSHLGPQMTLVVNATYD